MSNFGNEGSSPASRAIAITPDDDADLALTTRGVYVGGAGDLVAVTEGGDTVTFTGLLAGQVYPFKVKRVKEATTATDLVGLR